MLAFLEKYYTINQAIGLEINLGKDGGITISGCQIAINDKQLHFEKKILQVETVESLNKTFEANLPVALNLSGKGVLHKRVERVEAINQANFANILPNAKIDDFYIQHFASGAYSFVAVIRKTEADKWVDEIQKQGFGLLMLSLGPYPVTHILPQLNFYDNEIIFNNNHIYIDEKGEWLNYQYNDSATASFTLKIENEIIDQKLLVAYAAAFQLVLVHKLNPIQVHLATLNTSFEQLLDSKKFKTNGLLVLGVFFILLLVNFVVFSDLNTTNTKLTEQASRLVQNTNDLQGITTQINEKELLLQNLGWDNYQNKSLMVDRMAAQLPPEITLKEIAINAPDLSANQGMKTLRFFEKRINVQGISPQIIPVNEWIARLKAQKWVKDIQLTSYNYNNELNTGQFLIQIDY